MPEKLGTREKKLSMLPEIRQKPLPLSGEAQVTPPPYIPPNTALGKIIYHKPLALSLP